MKNTNNSICKYKKKKFKQLLFNFYLRYLDDIAINLC